MIKKYIKKSTAIEAIQWTGLNFGEIYEFSLSGSRNVFEENDVLKIEILEGVMRANIGDYIIKGVRGELYPCKEDIFLEIYKEVLRPFEQSSNYCTSDSHVFARLGTAKKNSITKSSTIITKKTGGIIKMPKGLPCNCGKTKWEK